MRSKSNKAMKLLKITKAPIKILCKARDVYVQCMLGVSGGAKVGYGSVVVGGGGGIARLPKSLSVNSSLEVNEEEHRQLLRLGSYMQHHEQQDGKSRDMDSNGMKRSYIVGLGKIGRIDEDKDCSFREDVHVNNLYPTGIDCAVRRKIMNH